MGRWDEAKALVEQGITDNKRKDSEWLTIHRQIEVTNRNNMALNGRLSSNIFMITENVNGLNKR